MGTPWEGLTKAERERVTGLAADLYKVSDPAPVIGLEPMTEEGQGKRAEIYEAQSRGEWDLALNMLRQWGRFVPAPLLAYVRARIWQEAGELPVAAVFFEHALRLDPRNDNYEAMLLD